MKKIMQLIFTLMFFAIVAKAQYVNIPDSNFRKFLIGKYPSCFNSAGMMDTTCGVIVNEDTLNIFDTTFLYRIKQIDGIKYFSSLVSFNCQYQIIDSIGELPTSLQYLNVFHNKIKKISKFPDLLRFIYLDDNLLNQLPSLPNSLSSLSCSQNNLVSLPVLPANIKSLYCVQNQISSLPYLPNSLRTIVCKWNQLFTIPNFPKNLYEIDCSHNLINSLPNFQPENKKIILNCEYNYLVCLPPGNPSDILLTYDKQSINCVPYVGRIYKQSASPNWFMFPGSQITSLPVCNLTNNPNHCHSSPIIQVFAFIDANGNGKLDNNEFKKSNLKVLLSNNTFMYTNKNGNAQTFVDSLGVYSIIPIQPNCYNAIPSNSIHNFSTYDTIVYDTFALQANTLKDSLTIKATPLNSAARPGFKYPYLIQYENIGTTILSSSINFIYDNNLLIYDSSSNNTVTNSGNNLSLSAGNLQPGQAGSFIAYFKVDKLATLGTNLISIANINGGTASAIDSVKSIIRGSYDPNDKQATPQLTTQQVSEGNYINYTIRFQNTGTDTAINIVIADTLSNLLQANNLQMVSSSHSCKTSIKKNAVYFEFQDIYLPDSNINKYGSCGFVNFKIKPVSSVVAGDVIPNKANIYFDYNKAVLTNIATTTIAYPLPLSLLAFTAIPQENKTILIQWNTLNEINTSHFILEQSIDGRTFANAAEIAAKGIGSNNYFYSLNQNSITFLRLKIVDKDGKIAYSNTIKISQLVNQAISILPNPVKNYLNIKVASASFNNTNAKLTNAQGGVIKSFNLHQGLQSIDIGNVPNGLYYLQTAFETLKVIVEK